MDQRNSAAKYGGFKCAFFFFFRGISILTSWLQRRRLVTFLIRQGTWLHLRATNPNEEAYLKWFSVTTIEKSSDDASKSSH